jgi:hypothetical protein
VYAYPYIHIHISLYIYIDTYRLKNDAVMARKEALIAAMKPKDRAKLKYVYIYKYIYICAIFMSFSTFFLTGSTYFTYAYRE